MSEPIFHIALAADWEGARRDGDYRVSTLGRSLAEEGFIHASRADQWEATRERFYGEVTEPLVLLVIDPDRLGSPVRDERVGHDTYPHIHGPIEPGAVVEVRPLAPAPASRLTSVLRVWRSLDEVPADLGRTVVTIGNFDGVHLGHQHVIRRARHLAAARGGRVVAITFDPHPMAVLRPEHAPSTLTDISTRTRLLTDAGVDDVLVLPFSREVAGWTPQEFIERVLVDGLHAAAVVVGANFRFGNRAAGDVATLRGAGAEHDFVVEGVELDGGPQIWSSTYVRTCLAEGDVEGAAEALGRPFVVTGEVVRGDQRGRDLGFPTANVLTRGLAAPADGVYAGWLRRLDRPDEGPLPAAISVGTNPTFDGERERRVEAYVLDRDDLELYGVPVEIAFVAHLRPMVRFEGIDALIETMKDDVERTREVLAR